MTKQALRKNWVLDVQWSDCPKEVEDEVKQLWLYFELGNDNYVLIRSISDFIEMEEDGQMLEEWVDEDPNNPEKEWGWIKVPAAFPNLKKYLREGGIKDDEEVWIHWWW